MKELSIEEKARRYDGAIKRLEDIETGNCQKTFMFTEGLFDYIFPELKESEDERIRKEIIAHIKWCEDSGYCAKEEMTRWITWLEKQGQVKESLIYQHENKMCKESDDFLTSEDEEIRKVLLELIRTYLRGNENGKLHGVYAKDILTWLEKQGEHANFRNKIQVGDKVTRNKDGMLVNLSQLDRVAKKDEKQGEQMPVGKVEPKFHEGDVIIHKELGGDYIHNPHKIIQVDILDKKYRLEGGLVAHFGEQDDYELLEQKPAKWSISDFRTWQYIVSDVLTKKDGIGQYLDNGECKKIAKYMQEEWSNRLSIEQEPKEYAKGEDYGIDGLYNAIQILEKTLGEVEGYQSDDGILEHKCAISAVKQLYEQKPSEWSEEDETRLTNIIIMLKEGASLHFNKKDITKAVDFLIILKERYAWKPSELQIEALESATENCAYSEYQDCLRELIGQLKKLKE